MGRGGGWGVGWGATNREVGKISIVGRLVGINEEANKNTTIRNFIEIKSSNDLVKISKEKT